MGLPRPDAGTPVHDYLAQHWSRMVILNWPCHTVSLTCGNVALRNRVRRPLDAHSAYRASLQRAAITRMTAGWPHFSGGHIPAG